MVPKSSLFDVDRAALDNAVNELSPRGESVRDRRPHRSRRLLIVSRPPRAASTQPSPTPVSRPDPASLRVRRARSQRLNRKRSARAMGLRTWRQPARRLQDYPGCRAASKGARRRPHRGHHFDGSDQNLVRRGHAISRRQGRDRPSGPPASDASGFVTGAQYNLNGGQLLGPRRLMVRSATAFVAPLLVGTRNRSAFVVANSQHA
jgi:hypothetical protein